MKFIKTIIVFFFLCAAFSCTKEKDSDNKQTFSILFIENPIMVGAYGGNFTSSFISDNQWIAETKDSWISDISLTKDNISFKVDPNPAEKPRDGKIRFSVMNSDYSRDLTIRQAGHTGKLKVDKTEVVLNTVGGKAEIAISASENWTASSAGEDWLKIERKNSTTLILSAKPNYTGVGKKTDVIVQTTSGKETVVVQVSQKADDSEFAGASTPMGRMFVHNTHGLVSGVVEENHYTMGEYVNALEMQFRNTDEGVISPYSLFIFEVDLTGDVTILVSCTDDEPGSIKKTDKEETLLTTIRDQFHSMQNKRQEIEVLCGVNGDFCFGGQERLNLLHGIMYKDGVCLKDTFDGGSVCTVFAVMKDGTARIMSQSQYAGQKNHIQEAIGGRQMLISSGQTVIFSDTRLEPRTAVGVSKDHGKVYLLVVDGRRSNYSIGASYSLLARIFHAFDVYDAINLDGGGSSTFLIKDAKAAKGFQTRNRPTDSAGDRALPNGLAVVKK